MAPPVKLRLPDGSVREVAHGTTVRQVAQGIGAGLAKALEIVSSERVASTG